MGASTEARTLLSCAPTAATAPTAWVCVFKSAYEAPTSRHPAITSTGTLFLFGQVPPLLATVAQRYPVPDSKVLMIGTCQALLQENAFKEMPFSLCGPAEYWASS